jgi:hypothetical protein
MFMQVIHGHVTDPKKAYEALDQWDRELAPTATGWLGTTAGVTADGHLVVLARFESREAAQSNSHRPEQDQWWTAVSKNFTGEATFVDSSDVMLDITGEPDKAGFVQVMQGRVTDPKQAREAMSQEDMTDEWAAFRPDVIGTVQAFHADCTFVMAIYFTSEADAREGEKKEPPAAIKEQMAKMDALSDGPPTFYDLRKPKMYTAR